jgi:hypothetical protein
MIDSVNLDDLKDGKKKKKAKGYMVIMAECMEKL